MKIELTKDEIKLIETAIWVAQQEDQLPKAEEDAELKALLDKLGIK